jgi:hypothetical protein
LITAYSSRFNFNATYGFCACLHKLGALTVNANALFGGFILMRTNDSGGNATGNAAVLITNNTTATGSINNTTQTNSMQCMSYSGGAGSTIYPTISITNSSAYGGGCAQPGGGGALSVFGLTSTLENSDVFIFPLYTIDPVIRFSNFIGNVLSADVSVGNTFSCAIIGATSLTYINFGTGFGVSASLGSQGGGVASQCSVCLWQ